MAGSTMASFDRQLTNALDNMHRELYGGRVDPHCQWAYNSTTDIYHCPHTAVFGKDLMARMPSWAAFNNPASDTVHEEHTL